MTMLTIMRHGEAAPGQPDRVRALTAFGLNQVRVQAEMHLKAYSFDKILCSPYQRTTETAHEVVKVLGNADSIELCDEIQSGSSVSTAMTVLGEVPDGDNWLIISHMPLVATLTEFLSDELVAKPFGTASIAFIDFEGCVGPPLGRLLRFEYYQR